MKNWKPVGPRTLVRISEDFKTRPWPYAATRPIRGQVIFDNGVEIVVDMKKTLVRYEPGTWLQFTDACWVDEEECLAVVDRVNIIAWAEDDFEPVPIIEPIDPAEVEGALDLLGEENGQ